MSEAKDASNAPFNKDAHNAEFTAHLDVLERDLKVALSIHDVTKLTPDELIKLDTYLAYVNSTLFYMHLKLSGSDASKHHILHDLQRAKEMLAREKQINDSLGAQRLDIPASKRFIAAGLHMNPKDLNKETKSSPMETSSSN